MVHQAGVRGPLQAVKNRVMEFVREVVQDPNVAPNHGWRHLFKTLGYESGIQERVLDAICGHAPASQGQAYGGITLKTKADALTRFPMFDVIGVRRSENGTGTNWDR